MIIILFDGLKAALGCKRESSISFIETQQNKNCKGFIVGVLMETALFLTYQHIPPP